MKKGVLVVAAVLAFTPGPSLAGLDRTAVECDATYGSRTAEAPSAEGVGMRRHYVWNGLLVGAAFAGTDATDRICGSLSYEKEVLATGVGPHHQITPEEIDGILAVNAGESSWERLAHGWRRIDGKAYAYEFRHERNGIPSNILAIFHGEYHRQLAARIRAD